MKRPFLIAIIVALVALLGGVFFVRAAQSKRNVIFIMLDTLRADHLSLYGYERETSPTLDQFARENLWFARTITSAPWTPPAVASMFTGLYPSAHGMMPLRERSASIKAARSLHANNITLAEVLKSHGYQTAGVTPNPWIKPIFGYNQGFDNYYYHDRARAEKINRAAFKILDTFDKEKPFFLFLHYLDPHDPYDPPAPYNTMFTGSLKAGTANEAAQKNINLYDGEIRYLDDHLAKLFQGIKDRNMWDNSIIVIIADHGEQFFEHGYKGHGHQLYNEEVHVPLFIKTGTESGKIEHLTSPIDIMPTILDLLSINEKFLFHGISLRHTDALAARPGVMSEIAGKFIWKSYTSSDGFRLIEDFAETGPDKPPSIVGLYAWLDDYSMKSPLNNEQRSRELKLDLETLYELVHEREIKSEDVQVEPNTLEQLRSLGYLK